MKAVNDIWKLELVPGGMSKHTLTNTEKQDAKKHIAAYLHYEGNKQAMRVRVTLYLVNHALGGATPAKTFTTTFGKDMNTHQGFTHLMLRDVLEDEDAGFKQNDCVVLRACITCLDLKRTVSEAERPFVPRSTTTDDMKHMLSSGYLSDFTINCGNRTFQAHRCVLGGRSPFFTALFASSMRDADSGTHTVIDVEPDVFEQLLLWIYTGEVHQAAFDADGMSEHLLMAAIQYACVGLMQLCEAKLCEGLSVYNVSTRLVLSEQAGSDELKEACMELIKSNASAVMKTEGWNDVKAAGSELMGDVLAVLANGDANGKKRDADQAGLHVAGDLRELTTARLKNELQDRNLSTDGRRSLLETRLADAIGEKKARRDPHGALPAEQASGQGSSSGGSSSSSSSSGLLPAPGATAEVPIRL